MSTALKRVYGTPAPQSEPIMGREKDMVQNAAGGYGFAVDPWTRLERFLIMGTDGGTYYAGEREHTIDNAKVVRQCIDLDGTRTVEMIASLSETGRAPSNEPAIFALAMAVSFGDLETKRLGAQALARVVRIGTHMLHFSSYVEDMRGRGRLLDKAMERWYLDKTPDELAFQTLKYRQRDGWSQADVLRLIRPKPRTVAQNLVMRAATWDMRLTEGTNDADKREVLFERERRNAKTGAVTTDVKRIEASERQRVWEEGPQAIRAMHRIEEFATLHDCKDVKDVVAMLNDYRWLSREMVPVDFLHDDKVWRAAFPNMGIHALVRNLGNLTRRGILTPMGEETAAAVRKLKNGELLRKQRVHPFQIILALWTYMHGKPLRGTGKGWAPVAGLEAALETAYEAAFSNLPKLDKRIYVAVDISGSMTWCNLRRYEWENQRIGAGRTRRRLVSNELPINAAQSAAAIAQVFMRSADQYVIHGFDTRIIDLRINARSSFAEVLRAVRSSFAEVLRAVKRGGGGTDIAAPVLYATQEKIPVDAFVLLTDQESWAGPIHVAEAMKRYRRKMGIDAKCAVLAMTAVKYSVADPQDDGMMDFVGVDASTPQLVADFIKG